LKKLNAFTLIKSKRQNKYFYDQRVKSTQWCHPLLFYILELHQRGMDVDYWYRELTDGPDDPVQIEACGTFAKEEITYYYQKYNLLRKNGFFSEIDTEHYLSKRLSADDVKSSLANTRQVTFEVVDFCNLECAYCTYGKFYDNYDRREKNKLSPATAKTFLDYLMDLLNSPLNQSHGRLLYIGFYGGEPLLNFPFIQEIVDYVCQLNMVHNRFCFTMTTNGLLLEKYMDFLAAHDFLLLISLDGNEYNNSYRIFKDGTPAYQQILKNVNALKTKYPDYFKSRVNFNAVFHNRNSVADIHHYFKTRFNKMPAISELNPSGVSTSMREEFWNTYANVNASLFQIEDYSLVEKDMFIRLPNIKGVSKFLDQCSGFVFNDYNDLLVSEKEGKTGNQEPRLPTGTCVPFDRKVFITVNGKILPCEQIGHQYSLGTVDESSVELDFEKIAETYNQYYDTLKTQCCACAHAEACVQCIFLLNIDTPNPKCNGLFNKEELSRYLATQISYLEKNPQNYRKIMKEVRAD